MHVYFFFFFFYFILHSFYIFKTFIITNVLKTFVMTNSTNFFKPQSATWEDNQSLFFSFKSCWFKVKIKTCLSLQFFFSPKELIKSLMDALYMMNCNHQWSQKIWSMLRMKRFAKISNSQFQLQINSFWKMQLKTGYPHKQ